MQTPLPVASYAFILRKHAWLVLGVTAAVLGAGFWYARNAPLVFRSSAVVLIQPPAISTGGERPIVVRDDPGFIADQNWRIRNDPHLAAEVKAHLLGQDRSPARESGGRGPIPRGPTRRSRPSPTPPSSRTSTPGPCPGWSP